jgi:hypothetical protein
MRKHFSFILLLALMLSVFSIGYAATVTIGTGTTTTEFFPVYGWYHYSYSQQIYTQSQINHAGDITKIRFYYSSGAIANSKDWTIYLGHTQKTSFTSNTDWEAIANLTQVFSGDVSTMVPSSAGWMEITLTTPFTYNNTDNLIVAVDENQSGYGRMYWGSFDSGSTTGIYFRTDSASQNPDPAQPPTATGTESSINRIQLIFPDTTPPLAPTLVNPVNGGYTIDGDELYWSATPGGADATDYDVYFGTTVDPPLVASNQTETSYVPTLQPGTTYYWKVVANNAIGSSPASEVWSFSTPGANQLAESFEDTTFPPPGWYVDGWSRNTTYAKHGDVSAAAYSSSCLLRTPMLSVVNGSSLNFWTRSGSINGILQVEYSTNGTDWTQLGTDITFAESGIWYNQDIDLGSLTPGNYYFGLRTAYSTSYYVDMVIGPEIAEVPPGAPTLVSPADAATFVSVTPTFTWNAPTTGGLPTSYNIYCDDGSNPTTLIGTSTTTSFTPENPLPYGSILYWTVAATNASGHGPTATPNSFTTLPEGLVFIGDGTSNNYLPIYPYYNFSYSQTIYLQSDINVADKRIEQIAFYWNGAKVGTASKDWVVYMAHTDKTAFTGAADWVPFNQLTPVFAGELDIPAEPGWVNIVLQSPFVYNNTQNLLIAVDENTSGNSGSSAYFYSTAVTDTRALIYYDDTTNPDPVAPPQVGYNGQRSAYANIRMQFGDLPTTPVFTYTPDAIDFGIGFANTPTEYQNVTVTNTGAGTLNLPAANISIIGLDAAMFELDPSISDFALATGQGGTIPVRYIPTTAGEHTATLRMVYEGSIYDVALSGTALSENALYESFEAATFPPAGWNAGSWTNSTTSYHEARSAYKYGSSYTQYTLSTPMLVIENDSRLNFWARCSNVSGVLQIVYSTDRTNWSTLLVGSDVTFTASGIWYNYDIDLSELAGDNYYIGFRTGLNGYYSYYVDYVIGPDIASIAPDTPTLTGPADGATYVELKPTFTWTAANTGGVATSYNIYCDASENPTTSIGTSTSTSFTPENALPYGSTLYWTVTAVNATGESDKATPRSFTTIPDPTVYTYPFTEGFEEGQTHGAQVGGGWTQLSNNKYWVANSTNTTYDRAPRNGDFNATLAWEGDVMLARPFSMQAGKTYEIELWARQNTTVLADATVGLYYGTEGTLAAMTPNVIVDQTGLTNEVYQQISGSFTPETDGIYWIGIYGMLEWDPMYLSMDDITVKIAPDIYAGEPYDALNMNGEYLGALFTSTQDLFKVPGFDGTTGPVAELNLDPANTHIAAYTAESGIFDLTFVAGLPGTYYLMGYWDGQWHQANFWPLIVQTGDIGETVLFDIQFAAKGDVYIVFTRGFDPTVPVELSHFAATITAQNYVQITWTTQSESNITGYNIYRNDSIDLGSAIKVSEMIEGTNTSEACTYTYLDKELEQSGTYYYWLQNVEMDGYTSYHGPVSVTFTAEDGGGTPDIPFVTKLENAYPNPFNPNTNIRYQLKEAGDVKIDIFNARGQLVRSFSRTHDAAGYYQINWDGRDSSGKAVSSGVYQYKMTSGKYHSTKKMVLKK